MGDKFRKIVVFSLTLIMLLNYSAQVVSIKSIDLEKCKCSDNCGCECKGKVTFNFINSVCFDSVGCGCSKGKNIPDFPIKEGLIVVVEPLMPLYPTKFFSPPENLTDLVIEFDVLHPPEV